MLLSIKMISLKEQWILLYFPVRPTILPLSTNQLPYNHGLKWQEQKHFGGNKRVPTEPSGGEINAGSLIPVE